MGAVLRERVGNRKSDPAGQRHSIVSRALGDFLSGDAGGQSRSASSASFGPFAATARKLDPREHKTTHVTWPQYVKVDELNGPSADR